PAPKTACVALRQRSQPRQVCTAAARAPLLRPAGRKSAAVTFPPLLITATGQESRQRRCFRGSNPEFSPIARFLACPRIPRIGETSGLSRATADTDGITRKSPPVTITSQGKPYSAL